jgi:hypothetical protein
VSWSRPASARPRLTPQGHDAAAEEPSPFAHHHLQRVAAGTAGSLYGVASSIAGSQRSRGSRYRPTSARYREREAIHQMMDVESVNQLPSASTKDLAPRQVSKSPAVTSK